MDRLREANRRGSLGGGSQISSLRRPRSGALKDFAGDEDEPSEEVPGTRLRERPRKDGAANSTSRHKRTRHASRELHSHTKVSEEAQGSEIGASDEDDDVPISSNLVPRKATKFRFYGKVTMEEGNAVDVPTVPRKARTAVLKRSHESLQGDSTRRQSHGHISQLSASVTPMCTASGSALKAIKRMKHNGQKVKAAKHAKVSASISISEQEVEVAEALFDLARMVSNMGSPLCNDDTKEVKMETGELKGTAWLTSPESTPVLRQDSIPTPPSSHSAISSPVRGPAPVTSLYFPAFEDSTKKICLSTLKIEEGTPVQAKTDLSDPVKAFMDSNGKSTGTSIVSIKSTGLTSQDLLHDAAAPSSVLAGQTNQSSQMSNINVTMANIRPTVYPKVENCALGSPMSPGSDAFLLATCLEQKPECVKEHKSPDACDISASTREKRLKTAYPCKNEIDLMVYPNGFPSGAIEKCGTNLDLSASTQTKLLQEQDNDSHSSNEKRDSHNAADACTTKKEGISSGTEKEPMQSVKHIKEENEKENETNRHLVKQEIVAPIKDSKSDSMKQHAPDRFGWPGSFSQAGYYPSAAAAAAAAAAIAAAWPATGSVIGGASMEGKGHPVLQVPPFVIPGARPVCKRCTTHVYIAHFIDAQQQMQRHSVWAAGGLYSMKPSNINAVLPPNTLFGSGLSGLTGLSVNNSPALKVFNTDLSPQNDNASAPGAREKSASLSTDGVDRKGALQFSHNGHQDQAAPLQVGLGPMFGYPHAGSSIVSAEAERSNALNRGTTAGGAGAVAASPLESTGVPSSKAESVNAAAAQVQYLQSIIQQTGFPFSFPPGHLIPPTQQQATQFYGNPFYNAPFVQQGTATGRTTPKRNSPQGQSTIMHHVSHSLSQQHQQQQQQRSSASSSQSRQRIASQSLQHFGDLGGEAISSAESKFPGCQQKNAQTPETPSMHASGISTSSSLYSVGMPAHVSVEAKQVADIKLSHLQSCGQGQVQQHSQKALSHYPSIGAESMEVQSPQCPSIQPVDVSKNMVGPGPLGLASVAAVMAPQGHTVLQTMADTQLMHNMYLEQSRQQSHSKYLEGCRIAADLSADGKRVVVKTDVESESSSRVSLTGLTSAQMQQNFPGVSFNFMASPAGNPGPRQGGGISASGAPVSIASMTGAVPSSKPVAAVRANSTTNMTAAALEYAALNKSTLSNIPLHISSVSGQHRGMREQGEASSQYPSQMKPVSQSQAGTCVSTAPTMLLSSSHAGVPYTKQLGYSGKSQQPPIASMQLRFPHSASGVSSAPAPASTSVSKSNNGSAIKTAPPGKGSLNSSQKQPSGSVGKKPDAILTHSPGQVVGASSMTVTMCQQQHQNQHQQIQHAIKQQQQQQQWQQQQQQQRHYLHQEHSQQGPLGVQHQQGPLGVQHQQVHVAGASPTVTVQYHQTAGTHQAGQAGVQKQPVHPHQMKQRLYLEQHFYQQQLQQESQLTESQHSARLSTQHQAAHRPVGTAMSHPMQQPSEMQHQQANKHQTLPSVQQPYSLVSYGPSSGAVVPHSSPSISAGNGSAVLMGSSDGALMQVISPKANVSMKPPGGSAAAVTGPNIQRSATPSSSGLSQVQCMGGKVVDSKLLPQSSSNISYLPYLHSATFSSSPPMAGKSHGVSYMHSQSGPTLKSMRDPSAGQVREESCTMHHCSNESPRAPLPSVNSHSSAVMASITGKSSTSQLNTDVKSASQITPLIIHGISEPLVVTALAHQSSQTCTATTPAMATDSVSTTG